MTNTVEAVGGQELEIQKEQEQNRSSVEKLYDACFGGVARWKRPIYDLRRNVSPIPSLCYVIKQHGRHGDRDRISTLQEAQKESVRVIAALRFWAVRIVAQAGSAGGNCQKRNIEKPALLFGPLAVEVAMQGKGFGKILVERGIADARRLNYGGILISGVNAYYRPFGFRTACVGALVMPRPSPGHVLMGLELKTNFFISARGKVLPAKSENALRAQK